MLGRRRILKNAQMKISEPTVYGKRISMNTGMMKLDLHLAKSPSKMEIPICVGRTESRNRTSALIVRFSRRGKRVVRKLY